MANVHKFEGETCRIFLVDGNIAFYDRENLDAWIGCERPLNLREWC